MSELTLHNLHSSHGSTRASKRVGRGGKRGTTSGRGTKGQRARSGGRNTLALKAIRHVILQTPQRRGHANKSAMKYSCVNLDILESRFSSGATVSPKDLVSHEMVRHLQKGIKVLGNGSITKKLHVKAHAFSARAREAIEKAGGKAEVIGKS